MPRALFALLVAWHLTAYVRHPGAFRADRLAAEDAALVRTVGETG